MFEEVSLTEWMARAANVVEGLHREHDRAVRFESREALRDYLADVEPCLRHLDRAARSLVESGVDASESPADILAAVYESIVAFGDELRLAAAGGREDLALLPEIVALARTEREDLAADVRMARHRQSARIRDALEALAIALVTVRVMKRAA